MVPRGFVSLAKGCTALEIQGVSECVKRSLKRDLGSPTSLNPPQIFRFAVLPERELKQNAVGVVQLFSRVHQVGAAKETDLGEHEALHRALSPALCFQIVKPAWVHISRPMS